MADEQPTTTNKRKAPTWSNHYYTGVQLFKEKNYDEAIRSFDQAIELKPNRLELYDCRAAVYEKTRNVQAAYRDAKKMIAMFPSSAKGYIRAGKILRLSGRYEAAYHVYESGRRKLKSDDPDVQLLTKYSQEAITLYKKSQTKGSVPGHSTQVASNHSVQESTPAIVKRYDLFEILPPELILEIFELLPYKTIWRCTRVCKVWRQTLPRISLIWRDADLSKNRGEDASYNITDATIKSVGTRGARHLRTLVAPKVSKLTNVAVKSLIQAQCTRIESLVITENRKITSDTFLRMVATVDRHLQILNLSSTSITDRVVVRVLEGCTNLRSLDISCNREITDNAFHRLSTNPGPPMVKLKINDCPKLSDRAVYFVTRGLRQLRSLDISNNSLMTKKSIINLSHIATLTHLSLTGIDFKNPATLPLDDAFLMLADKCSQLRELSLLRCPQLSQVIVEYLTTFCGQLESLDLRENANLNDDCIRSIASNCVDLRNIAVAACPNITELGMNALLRGCPSLTHIDISRNPNIGDDFLVEATRRCTQLAEINISFCRKITGNGVIKLIRKFQATLNALKMDGCNGVSSETVMFARQTLGPSAVSCSFSL
ncbi:RNI-like protein [Basidiobolus meristosporus CBS 931.73]|uniref:RNI-like protein n=1 Tax=Basidiobolus meristosporus CBS 931.73 TaxID=1314790 RepID=A0A1Y1Y0F8_9FUNG|nr:RNI-like protein [Basidiobolus meristosporus CBS 931.73]|eukprot:ORX91502.1 RNI-like protein [Basidiobolus meristosporus CBS 931.73]